MNSEETLLELGRRIRYARVNMELRQADLATRAAVSPLTLSRAERGLPIGTDTLFRILNQICEAGALVDLLPKTVISPIAMQKLNRKQPVRVRRVEKHNPKEKYATQAEVDAFHARKAAARVADWEAIRSGQKTAEEVQIKNSMFKSEDIQKSKILSYPSF